MKFFWKLFFSIVLITELFLGIGGCVLIQSVFNHSIRREIEAAWQESDLLCISLNHGLLLVPEMTFGEDVGSLEEILNELCRSIMMQTSGSAVPFSLSSPQGTLVAGSRPEGLSGRLVERLEGDERGYEIQDAGDVYYIHCARPVRIQGMSFFVENYRDITSVFQNQSQYVRTFSILMVLVLVVGGSVIFLISYWLVRPIRQLSRASKQLAAGVDMTPVKVRSNDEIGTLADDFNRMSGKLSENIEELKNYAKRQEMFVGNFDHELKTPLTSIIGYGDMIRSKRLSEEQTVLLANQIVQEGKRLEAMSKKLMELTVLKHQDFQMRRVSAKAFLTSVYDTVFPAMEGEHIRFIARIQEGRLCIEPDLMKTVCINLLDNARKAIDSDDGQVILSGKALEDGYEISVEDNGQGIPASELSKISDAFYMVNKAQARGRGGAGLGLALCKEIVEIHHSELKFRSRPGEGTCVRFVIKEAEDRDVC